MLFNKQEYKSPQFGTQAPTHTQEKNSGTNSLICIPNAREVKIGDSMELASKIAELHIQ